MNRIEAIKDNLHNLEQNIDAEKGRLIEIEDLLNEPYYTDKRTIEELSLEAENIRDGLKWAYNRRRELELEYIQLVVKK